MKGKRKPTSDPQGYACPKCGVTHRFTASVMAQLSSLWAHACTCGQQSILVNGKPCALEPGVSSGKSER